MKLIALAFTLLFTLLSATFALAKPAYKDTGFNIDSLNDEAAAGISNVGRRDLPELQRRNKSKHDCELSCGDQLGCNPFGPHMDCDIIRLNACVNVCLGVGV